MCCFADRLFLNLAERYFTELVDIVQGRVESISLLRVRHTFRGGLMVGVAIAASVYAMLSLVLPSGWRHLPELLFNEGVDLLLAIFIIAGIAGKYKNNRGLAGLLAGVIFCFYASGGLSILMSG